MWRSTDLGVPPEHTCERISPLIAIGLPVDIVTLHFQKRPISPLDGNPPSPERLLSMHDCRNGGSFGLFVICRVEFEGRRKAYTSGGRKPWHFGRFQIRRLRISPGIF